MKIRKLYIRLQFNSTHQLIRVDNVTGFKTIVESEDFYGFLDLQNKLMAAKIAAGEKYELKPFEVNLIEADFKILEREINRKYSNWKKIEFNEFYVVMNSTSLPIIIIKRWQEQKKV